MAPNSKNYWGNENISCDSTKNLTANFNKNKNLQVNPPNNYLKYCEKIKFLGKRRGREKGKKKHSWVAEFVSTPTNPSNPKIQKKQLLLLSKI